VTTEEAVAHAKNLDALFVEVSAKTGDNITQLFRQIAQALPGNTKQQSTPEGLVDIKLSVNPPPAEPVAKKCRC